MTPIFNAIIIMSPIILMAVAIIAEPFFSKKEIVHTRFKF